MVGPWNTCQGVVRKRAKFAHRWSSIQREGQTATCRPMLLGFGICSKDLDSLSYFRLSAVPLKGQWCPWPGAAYLTNSKRYGWWDRNNSPPVFNVFWLCCLTFHSERLAGAGE